MPRVRSQNVAELVREAAHPRTGAAHDYDALLQRIGNAHFVLLGEASHGTHEFYRERALLTRRLIEEKGFTAVAVEADWPDAYRVNRFVQGVSHEHDAEQALSGFRRFPAWMWRNTEVRDFVGWLRRQNEVRKQQSLAPVGFYGVDLYSLYASIEAVLAYLDKVDPEAAKRARYRYSCFEHFGEDPQAYGYATSFGLSEPCEEEVARQLTELRRSAEEYARRDGRLAPDDYFYTEQNARLVRNAERYYRAMFAGRISSWNLRDRHMAETLDALVAYLRHQGQEPRVVVWEHNSHLGDARATDMAEDGELNVGQLVRERYGSDAVLIGFTTYSGTVTAASAWGGMAERKHVRPALAESIEALLHETPFPEFYLLLDEQKPLHEALSEPKLERAIGVIYMPRTERISHYFHARIAQQFDAVIHLDETRALEPLERTSEWERGELPESFPFGI